MGQRNAGFVRAGFRRGNNPLVSSTVQFWVDAADPSVPSARVVVAGTDYVAPGGVAGGQTIKGGTLTTQTLTLRANAVDAGAQVTLTSNGAVVGSATDLAGGTYPQSWQAGLTTTAGAVVLARPTAISTTGTVLGTVSIWNGATEVVQIQGQADNATDAGGLIVNTKRTGSAINERLRIDRSVSKLWSPDTSTAFLTLSQSTAQLQFGGGATFVADSSNIRISGTGNNVLSVNYSTGAAAGMTLNAVAFTHTSGNGQGVQINQSFTPTSGTGTFQTLDLVYTVNQTGGANGTVDGLLVEATQTAAIGTHNLIRARMGGNDVFSVRPSQSGVDALVQLRGDNEYAYFQTLNFNYQGTNKAQLRATSTGNVELSSLVGGGTLSVFADLVRLGQTNANIASAAGATWDAIKSGATNVVITGATNITTATGFNCVSIPAPTLQAASALTVSDSATVYIAGAPAGGGAGPATITRAYALWIDNGLFRYDGQIALGGGAAPTFGTIGGTGPATAAQNSWIKINVDGNSRFIPLWA